MVLLCKQTFMPAIPLAYVERQSSQQSLVQRSTHSGNRSEMSLSKTCKPTHHHYLIIISSFNWGKSGEHKENDRLKDCHIWSRNSDPVPMVSLLNTEGPSGNNGQGGFFSDPQRSSSTPLHFWFITPSSIFLQQMGRNSKAEGKPQQKKWRRKNKWEKKTAVIAKRWLLEVVMIRKCQRVEGGWWGRTKIIPDMIPECDPKVSMSSNQPSLYSGMLSVWVVPFYGSYGLNSPKCKNNSSRLLKYIRYNMIAFGRKLTLKYENDYNIKMIYEQGPV